MVKEIHQLATVALGAHVLSCQGLIRWSDHNVPPAPNGILDDGPWNLVESKYTVADKQSHQIH